MTKIYEFVISALPWIAIGLFVACSFVTAKAKEERKEVSEVLKCLSWSPAVCFLFLAILEMRSGNRSSGTTWLILGVFNTLINFLDTR